MLRRRGKESSYLIICSGVLAVHCGNHYTLFAGQVPNIEDTINNTQGGYINIQVQQYLIYKHLKS